MDTKVTARLAETIANATKLKLFAGIDREVGQFKGVTDEHQRARYKAWTLGLYSDSIQAFSVRALQIMSACGFCALMAQEHSHHW